MRAATLRITKELKLLHESGQNISPNESNLLELSCVILGPENSVYEGGKFVLKINVPPEYPFKCPTAKFETNIYHPNVSPSGEVCLKSLQERWKAGNMISDLIDFVVNVLASPNVDDPLSADVAFVYKTDYERYKQIGKEWTTTYAK